jgi:hypothetical protein
MIFIFFRDLAICNYNINFFFFVFLVLSIQKHVRKYKHTHTHSFYYILLTTQQLHFLHITKIQNDSNTHTIKIYNL